MYLIGSALPGLLLELTLMAYDIGPFQQVIAVSFPDRVDDYDVFIDGEEYWLYYPSEPGGTDCDETTKVDSGRNIGKDPYTTGCACEPYAGSESGTQFTILIKNEFDWPTCIVGKTSGGVLKFSWPPEPDGWGSSPQPFQDFGGQQSCSKKVKSRGTAGVNYYQVRILFQESCAGTSPGMPPDFPCCG